MLHYTKQKLETGFYDGAILPVGVNDILNGKLPISTGNLM